MLYQPAGLVCVLISLIEQTYSIYKNTTLNITLTEILKCSTVLQSLLLAAPILSIRGHATVPRTSKLP